MSSNVGCCLPRPLLFCNACASALTSEAVAKEPDAGRRQRADFSQHNRGLHVTAKGQPLSLSQEPC